MTDEARFKKKNGSNRLKPGSNFCHFLEFGSLVFLEIAYSHSLQRCLTSSRDKLLKKSWGLQI